MARKDTVTVQIYSNAIHIEQVMCAAKLWCERNGHELKIEYVNNSDPYYISAVKVFVNSKSILVDCSDSPELLNVKDSIDVYYKRSLLNGYIHKYTYPVMPFGFNYGVAYKPLALSRIKSFEKDKTYLCRTFPILNRFANFNYDYIDYRKMHGLPKDNGGNILLLTRLWDPATVRAPEKKEFRKHLNNVRIETVRMAKHKFGKRMIAGIEDSPLARELCPDIIVQKQITSKRNYLHRLSNADICIATNGLENTLGWRIGEYVAFSKAIVTEPFNINIPGWEEEKHYKIFTADTLIDRVEELLDTKWYVAMQQCNYEYYKTYLEPEALFNRLISFQA